MGAPLAAATPAERAQALVARMTQTEKLQLVHGWWYPPNRVPTPGMPTEWSPSAGYIPAIPRLGIPALRESDASLGVANQVEERPGDTATALPAALATAASFDPEAARAGGAMIGREARAKRFNVLLAGGVNLTRDPWNGRNFEYMGEDPLLAGTMAGAAIAGVQSAGVASTVKHFVLNAQETGRNVLDARLDEESLRESDLLAFELAIERGAPASVMCGYNMVNGFYACENRSNLSDVLKRDWGYSGWVMSDWGAVHSTEDAANAGLDQESGQQLDKEFYFARPLADAVAAGRVPQARLDEMVRRILTGMISVGLIDRPLPDAVQPLDAVADKAVAERAAEEGIVLLKNEADLLPLARAVRRVVVIGAHADVGVLSGGGSSQVRSVGGVPVEIPLKEGDAASFARITWHASSPLRALQALLPGVAVSYVDGHDLAAAARAAASADLVLVFAWQWQTEAQDAATLALPDNQDALIAAVAATNHRTAVVLETGGPVLMPWLGSVPAVVEAWYPGQGGGEAIARVLTGAATPSGHLPITFPAYAAQAPRSAPVGLDLLHRHQGEAAGGYTVTPLPHFRVDYPEGANVGHRWYELKREKPLFAFGHGLSYTRFRLSGLVVSGGQVRFTVTNDGRREGTDVAQVYLSAPDGHGVITRRLGGWSRVSLAPGASREVTVTVDPRTVSTWDVAARRWVTPAEALPLEVGHAVDAPVLSGSMRLG